MSGPEDLDTGMIDVIDVEEQTNDTYYYYLPEWNSKDQLGLAETLTNVTTFPMVTTTRMPEPDIFELNRQKSLTFYPLFIILGSIVVLGVLSNVLVCYIYRCRSRRATSNFFVIFFAIFDMFGCFVGIPLEVSALALPYMYDVAALCKIMGFIGTVSVCGLCLTYICVAYDCYRKLCRPGEDFGVKKARWWCVAAIVVAVLVSIPALAVFGTKKVKTFYADVYGDTCSIDPSMPQWLVILYNVCVLGTFTLSLCVMSVLYCLIGVSLCKQRQAEERGEKPSPAKRDFPKKHRFVREDTSTSSVGNYMEEICRLHSQSNISHSNTQHSDPARVPLKTGSTGIVKSNSLQASSAPPSVTVQLHVKNSRQASIFMMISILFVITMLPFVVVRILCAATNVFDHFSSNATEIVFNLCIRSYLFNYLVKPVVYIIFNLNFRKEVKQLFNTVWAVCSHSPNPTSNQQSSRQLRRSFTMGAPRSISRTPIYKAPRSST